MCRRDALAGRLYTVYRIITTDNKVFIQEKMRNCLFQLHKKDKILPLSLFFCIKLFLENPVINNKI